MCHHFAEVWKQTQMVTHRRDEICYKFQEQPKNHQGYILPWIGNCWKANITVHSDASFTLPWTERVLTKKEGHFAKSVSWKLWGHFVANLICLLFHAGQVVCSEFVVIFPLLKTARGELQIWVIIPGGSLLQSNCFHFVSVFLNIAIWHVVLFIEIVIYGKWQMT